MESEFLSNSEQAIKTAHVLVDELQSFIRVLRDRDGNTYNKPKHADMNMRRSLDDFTSAYEVYNSDPEGSSGWRK